MININKPNPMAKAATQSNVLEKPKKGYTQKQNLQKTRVLKTTKRFTKVKVNNPIWAT
jgi:hypothetical protein